MKRKWIAGLSISLVALCVRLAWSLLPRMVRWDEADYLIISRNLLRGDGYQVFGVPELIWPPGPPLLAAVAQTVGVALDRSLAFWHIVAGALACGILYMLAQEITGSQRVSILAGMLAAISPALTVWPLYWGSLTEPPFLMLWLAGLWATWRMLRGGGWGAALSAGLLFGASYLVRTEGLFWWCLFLAVALLMAIRRRLGWSSVSIFSLSFLLIASPYVAYLYRHTGRLMLSGKTGITLLVSPKVIELGGLGQDYAATLDSSGREILWLSPERFDVSLLDVVRSDPKGMLRQIASNFALASKAVRGLFDLFTIMLVGLGIFGEPWKRRRWQGELFLAAALLPLGVLFISKVETRYLIPLVPIGLIWAARGITHIGRWCRAFAALRISSATWQRIGLLVVVTFLVALSMVRQTAIVQAERSATKFSHQAAGLWLSGHIEQDATIMTRNTEVVLYADRPVVPFPNATWDQVVTYGRAHNARYLVVDTWEITALRPQLARLLDPIDAPPEVEYLQTFADASGTATLVYRFLD